MQKRLEGFFLVLSAALIWLTNPPNLISSVLDIAGIDQGSSLAIFMTGVAIGAAILFLQILVRLLIECVVWPALPGYLGGIWIYALRPAPIGRNKTLRRSSVGLFTLHRKGDIWVAANGIAYVLSPETPEPRGTWYANHISVTDELIEIFYRFTPHFEYSGQNRSEFDGIMRIRRSLSSGTFGTPYRGEFNSLKGIDPALGAVYAEHVTRYALLYERIKLRLLGRSEEFARSLDNY